MSDCCLMPIQQFSAISWLEQVNFHWDVDKVHFVLDQHAELDFIVLAHWNNSLRVDMSLHLDTLFWFQANQSLLILLNAVCLAEKQQIPILQSLVWPNRDSNLRSITLEASMPKWLIQIYNTNKLNVLYTTTTHKLLFLTFQRHYVPTITLIIFILCIHL